MAKGKKYQVNGGLKILKTNQENIVIPTNEIIKRKEVIESYWLALVL